VKNNVLWRNLLCIGFVSRALNNEKDYRIVARYRILGPPRKIRELERGKITLVKLDAFLEWDLMTPRNAERISLDALAIDRGAINQKQRFIPL